MSFCVIFLNCKKYANDTATYSLEQLLKIGSKLQGCLFYVILKGVLYWLSFYNKSLPYGN